MNKAAMIFAIVLALTLTALAKGYTLRVEKLSTGEYSLVTFQELYDDFYNK